MQEIEIILREIESTIKNTKELDYFYTHRDRYCFILEKVIGLNLNKKARILDVGCYPPHLFNALGRMGFDIWGISSSHEPIKSDKVFSVNIETGKLPLKNSFFDLIIFTETIEHLVIDPRIYLAKLNALLRPGGKMLVTTPNVGNLKNRGRILLGKNIYFGIDQLYETQDIKKDIYFRHNREFTATELMQVLKDANFKISEKAFFSAYSPFRKRIQGTPLKSKIIKGVGFYLTQIIPFLRDSIYCLVIK